ncbi:uncharacterized protein LOC132730615 [Ruditapes philippinarum]|uniref:uncharacterized protein LOC132730615 n=1 Tax=Ruditapes philippinarum TaxID=129788 RepID=UPI00295B0945|nr:uncharacterized protein LOC132730615 [Ruditapes philippinarum]
MSQQSQSVASLFQTSASFHGVCSDADTVITNPDFDDSSYDIVDDNLLSSDLLSLCPLETLTKDVQDNMNMPSMSVTADESRPSYPEGSATNAPSQTASFTSDEKSKHNNKTHQKRTLKDLQMTYYERQIQLSETQMKCYNKFAQLADVLIEKYKID